MANERYLRNSGAEMNTEYLATFPEWFQLPRLLPLEGAYNVRDLGGYPVAGGRFVACGMVYRADDLHRLTEHDIQVLADHQITTTIDFRAGKEKAAAPDCLIPSVVNAVHLAIEPANVLSFRERFADLTVDKGKEMMNEIYASLVLDFQDVYRKFFEILQNKQAAPLLFHCSGGKDRTGFGAALFLSALGVDREIILEDYMLSRDRMHLKYGRDISEHPQLEPLLTVSKSYLETAFRTMDEAYGGVNAYLTRQLEVDIEHLKKVYTVEFLDRERIQKVSAK